MLLESMGITSFFRIGIPLLSLGLHCSSTAAQLRLFNAYEALMVEMLAEISKDGLDPSISRGYGWQR